MGQGRGLIIPGSKVELATDCPMGPLLLIKVGNSIRHKWIKSSTLRYTDIL